MKKRIFALLPSILLFTDCSKKDEAQVSPSLLHKQEKQVLVGGTCPLCYNYEDLSVLNPNQTVAQGQELRLFWYNSLNFQGDVIVMTDGISKFILDHHFEGSPAIDNFASVQVPGFIPDGDYELYVYSRTNPSKTSWRTSFTVAGGSYNNTSLVTYPKGGVLPWKFDGQQVINLRWNAAAISSPYVTISVRGPVDVAYILPATSVSSTDCIAPAGYIFPNTGSASIKLSQRAGGTQLNYNDKFDFIVANARNKENGSSSKCYYIGSVNY